MANRTLYIFSWIALLAVCPFQIQNVSGLACGKVNLSRPLIQDGNPALRGEWPFIAALHKVRESKFFCGGTLITNQHVLTGNSDFVAPMLGSIGNKWKKKTFSCSLHSAKIFAGQSYCTTWGPQYHGEE